MYAILRLLILMVTLCFILWLNSTKFDVTEIKSLVTFFLVAAGVEGVSAIFPKKSP